MTDTAHNASHPMQITVADQHGLDVPRLIAAIQHAYRSVNGNPVKVELGQGIAVNGVPEGMLLIKDRS